MGKHQDLLTMQAEPTGMHCAPIGSPDDRMAQVMRTIRLILKTMLHAESVEALVHGLCRNIIEEGCFLQVGIVLSLDDGPLHWVGWIRSDGISFESVDLAALNALALTLDDERAEGAVVLNAMRTRHPCFRRPLFDDEFLARDLTGFRDCAIALDARELTALPMMNNGQLIGALFVGSPKPGVVEEDSLRFLMALADDLGQGILAARLRERHERALATIERLAFEDTLTGLPNRTRYLILLQQLIDRQQATSHQLAVLHIKLVKLDEIREILGHAATERLIAQIASKLESINVERLPLARIADGSFALVAQVDDADGASRFAQDILRDMSDGIRFGEIKVNTRLHIGIALSAVDASTADELDHQAEAALRNDGGPVRLYTGAKAREHALSLALIGDLQHAICKNALDLYCQPKIDLGTGMVVGSEALLRWRHPVHGDIPPARFISLAENSDMISQLTEWLLGAVESWIVDWQGRGLRWPIAINLSAHDLQHQAVIERIEEMVVNGVDPALIQFELTESVLVEDPLSARRSLDRLRRRGFELAIDDFGTGFSGLSYLQNFQVDCIKIDQFFIKQMLSSCSAEAIVRSTIELGHQLGHTIIAEGIEELEVWRRLKDFGCDIGQGYFIGKPMPIGEFESWVKAWSVSAGPQACGQA